MGWFSKRASSDIKNFVIGLSIHENKNEAVGDYSGDFKMMFAFVIGDHEQTTAMRF